MKSLRIVITLLAFIYLSPLYSTTLSFSVLAIDNTPFNITYKNTDYNKYYETVLTELKFYMLLQAEHYASLINLIITNPSFLHHRQQIIRDISIFLINWKRGVLNPQAARPILLNQNLEKTVEGRVYHYTRTHKLKKLGRLILQWATATYELLQDPNLLPEHACQIGTYMTAQAHYKLKTS